MALTVAVGLGLLYGVAWLAYWIGYRDGEAAREDGGQD